MNRQGLITMLVVFLLGTVGSAQAQPMGEIGARWPTNQGDTGPVTVTLGAELVTDMSRTEVQMLLNSDLLNLKSRLVAGNLWFNVVLDSNPNATYSGSWWDGQSTACWFPSGYSCTLASCYTHWEKSGVPPEMLDVRRIAEIDKAYYSGGPNCTGVNYCWHNCATGTDTCSPDNHYNFDVGTVDMHEDMHGVIGAGHYQPCDPATIMFPIAELDCHQGYPGYIDDDYATGTLAGIAYDLNEPANDYSPGAVSLGTLAQTGDEVSNGLHRLPGYIDMDWFSFDVIGDVYGWNVIVWLYPLTNTGLNLAGTAYHEGQSQGTFNSAGIGQNEVRSYEALTGHWTVKVFTPNEPIPGRPDESTYTRGPNVYRIRVQLIRPVCDVPIAGSETQSVQFAVSPHTGSISGSGLRQAGTLAVYDPSGRQVWSRPVPERREWSERITNLANGIYFVRLAAGPGTHMTQKMVVVR